MIVAYTTKDSNLFNSGISERFRSDSELFRIDPYARQVTSSVGHGVIYHDDFAWEDDNFRIPSWNELVIYELHIGTFARSEDGKAGMRGRLVSKQGQLLANALIAGVASGIGQAFQQSSTTFSVSPLGSTSTLDPSKQLEAGLGAGVGKALDSMKEGAKKAASKLKALFGR